MAVDGCWLLDWAAMQLCQSADVQKDPETSWLIDKRGMSTVIAVGSTNHFRNPFSHGSVLYVLSFGNRWFVNVCCVFCACLCRCSSQATFQELQQEKRAGLCLLWNAEEMGFEIAWKLDLNFEWIWMDSNCSSDRWAAVNNCPWTWVISRRQEQDKARI
jgi:hypothetical protein